MTYQETLDYLFSRLPMLQNKGLAAIKPGLERISRICDILDNPERKFKSVHIAGTNGKGSVANMLCSVLIEAGYKVGLYTSPHFKDFRERIKINGKCIPQEAVISFVSSLKESELPEPSFFEYSTAMAFQHFAEEEVDIAIIETGLGGRLDSTNVITPLLSVITSISLDHTEFLGSTVEEIAKEKAGIIKNGVPLVSGIHNPSVEEVFIDHANANKAKYHFVKDVFIKGLAQDLPFRKDNVDLVIKSAEILSHMDFQIGKDHIREGINRTVENTGFYGRWYRDSEKKNLYFDVAHNTAGVAHVLEKAKSIVDHKGWNFVFGVVRDKDLGKIMDLLPEESTYYLCEAKVPRALPLEELEKTFKSRGFNYFLSKSVEEAVQMASAQGKPTLVFGSFFVVAEALPEKIFEKFN
ncbi:bifunctional folylpolyglutamate synthase/dihydrofolate synthase [Luteibaculum oceani]|uniref:Dihydrofolate synthase/folylpolyglutamate synthase n=1 Tax=Luteibaculum oceani TaxID=1294296 RepID=A0A5C6V1R6_9FLAO|nr:folylpolyglutamate synthase/dihydrofolate synthase family protein [Luteibaculum oceani]TXC78780.1 bifunctional folylpolyglutamate synthase/dihydrofolate synthase [Luteibaculum oceani]